MPPGPEVQNIRLMDLLGEPGVAAHSVMMYVDFVFVAAFLGFSMGSAPFRNTLYSMRGCPRI